MSNGNLTVTVRSAVFPNRAGTHQVPSGLTVAEILDALRIHRDLWNAVTFEIGGHAVPREGFESVRPKAGHVLTVLLVPQGPGFGADDLRTLGVIGVSLFGQILPELFGVGGIWGGVIRVAAQLLGYFGLFTFIQAPTEPTEVQNYSLTGTRNRLNPYGAVPKIYGRHRIFPPMAAVPITELYDGDRQRAKVLLALGYKPLRITELKVGELDLSDFTSTDGNSGILHYSETGWEFDPPPTDPVELYSGSRDAEEESVDRELAYCDSWTRQVIETQNGEYVATYTRPRAEVGTFTTQDQVTEIGVDLVFPQGLYRRAGNDVQGERVDIECRYRPVGGGEPAWINVLPAWDPAIQNEAVEDFISDDTFARIEELQVIIDETVTVLHAVATGQRLVAAGLRVWLQAQMGRVQFYIQSRLLDEDLTGPQRTALNDTYTSITDLATELDNSADQTDANADDLGAFNDGLSGLVAILHGVDNYVTIQRYIAQGYGPDINTLPVFWRWMVGKWNLTRLFGEPATGTFAIFNEAAHPGVYRRGFHWYVPPGRYEVQVRRVTPEVTDENVFNTVNLDRYRSFRNTPPISAAMRERVALLALQMDASEKLNGQADQVNCIAEAPLYWHDGTEWRGPALTDDDDNTVSRNPAWIYCDILRGSATSEPIADERIDLATIRDFAEHCNDIGYTFDGIFDRHITEEQAMQNVLAAAFASPHIRDGKFSVVWDRLQTTPVAVISPRNSRNLRASRSLEKRPQALRCRFVNPDAGYGVDETTVYLDGFGVPGIEKTYRGLFNGGTDTLTLPFAMSSVDAVIDKVLGGAVGADEWTWDPETNTIARVDTDPWADGALRFEVQAHYMPTAPERVETLDLIGITDTQDDTSDAHTGLAHRHGRYALAVGKLRREVYQIDQDWEHLVVERGDLVLLQHDVLLVGLGVGRILAFTVDGDDFIETITLDETITMEADVAYQANIRTATGAVLTGLIVTDPGGQTTIEFSPTIDPGDETVALGDLVIWGESGRVSTECLVTRKAHKDELSATLELIEYQRAVHYAAEFAIPEYDPNITIPPRPDLVRPPSPEILAITTDESVLFRDGYGQLQSQIVLSLRLRDSQTSQPVTAVQVQYRLATGDPVLYAPHNPVNVGQGAGSASWTSLPYVTQDLTRVNVQPVQDGQFYDVRVRAVTDGGLVSDWALAYGIEVLGKSTPPPDVLRLLLSGTELVWDYPAPPLDHDGFLVRVLYGSDGTWESAQPAHDSVLRATRFPLDNYNGGLRVFLVKAVDQGGIESRNAARITFAIGDPIVENVVESFDHRDLGWPGTKTNMTVDSGDLKEDAGSSTGFYRGRRGEHRRFYLADVGAGGADTPFYTTLYPGCSYEFEIEVDEAWDLSAMIHVYVEATGDEWRLEYLIDDPVLWPLDLDAPLWPLNLNDPLWPPGMTWTMYTGPIAANSTNTYRFRITAPANNTRLVISECRVVLDISDVLERFEDFEVSASGTVRLPITKQFNAIKNVQLTLQQDGAYPDARTAEVLDKNNTLGPSVQVLDDTHARAAGLIDAVVQGY